MKVTKKDTDEAPPFLGRPAIGSNAPLLRAKVDPALKAAVVRSAAAEGITDAEFLRRVLEAHFARVARAESDFFDAIEAVRRGIEANRRVLRLLVPMVELALKAVLMRVPPAGTETRDQRASEAGAAFALWQEQLMRRVAEGQVDEWLAFLGQGEAGRVSGD